MVTTNQSDSKPNPRAQYLQTVNLVFSCPKIGHTTELTLHCQREQSRKNHAMKNNKLRHRLPIEVEKRRRRWGKKWNRICIINNGINKL